MSEQIKERLPVERFVSIGKDMVVVLRDATLLGLAGLLLVFPTRFNDLLVNAGFEEGSFIGFKWKAKLIESDDALQAAQATISDLAARLEMTTKALTDAQSRTPDPALKAQITQLEEGNRRTSIASAQVVATVRSTIASNAPLVQKAQSDTASSGGWGVVFGSDVSLQAANDEIRRASAKGITGAAVYFRNNYYASIAITDDRAAAQQYLGIARTFRPDAYIATMSTWCRNPQTQAGFTECR